MNPKKRGPLLNSGQSVVNYKKKNISFNKSHCIMAIYVKSL